ncbi:hypothetical protein LJR039_001811 [Pseudorhodoferax sp. LjRoot39]|uniref:hypothetical protein n=1 Tax=Pseudorhodoferax sp. LjRoot39 TaxID=3342328 RepID=UPI003ECED3B9
MHLFRYKPILPALTMVWAGLPALAQTPVPAPAASAASAPAASPSMSIVGEWQGPFPGTKVVKLMDGADGVACYFYVPVSVPSNTVCNGNEGCNVQYPSGVGTVSCVKVREGDKAPAKAAAKPSPRR